MCSAELLFSSLKGEEESGDKKKWNKGLASPGDDILRLGETGFRSNGVLSSI